ncbi:hypothetical protein [Nocardia sp. NRRL S-836]|uniref:hypothetical protein n=1 Tax=Nocardia sp. NRRL S-836 TaxID=1519492 RepID=UPI0012FA0CE0|nr:hypothetical protein [Nocardia sp. NRRL S-836]
MHSAGAEYETERVIISQEPQPVAQSHRFEEKNLIDVSRALVAVALATAAAAAVPAQAVSAPIAVEHATARTASGETCTPEKDEYSADNGTSVRWRGCFGDHGGSNASFQAKCWSKPAVFWSRAECRVRGHFVIRDPQGNQVSGGNFGVFSDRHNEWGSNTFRFSCGRTASTASPRPTPRRS